MLYDSVVLLLVLFVCSLNNEVVLFCVCVVCFLFFVTRLSGFLVCILWSYFLSCCFVLIVFLFSFPLKRTKTGHSNPPPKKNIAEKRVSFSVSAVVFANSVPNFFAAGLKIQCFAESAINVVVSAYFATCKTGQKCQKGWVKTWSKYVAQHNWTKFWLKKVVISVFLFRFSKRISFSLQKEEMFEKQKKK